MTITPFVIYLIGTIPDIKFTLAIFGLFTCVGFAMETVIAIAQECKKSTVRTCRRMAVIGALLIMISSFLPNGKTLAAMYVLPTVINDKEFQQLPHNVIKYSNQFLKDLIKEPKK